MAENYDDGRVYFQGDPDFVFHTITFPYWRSLKKGMSGGEIVVLQKLLEEAGCYSHSVKYKYVFDDSVEAGVKKFQQKKGLVVDGVVGPITAEKLHDVFYTNRGGLYQAYIYDDHNGVIACDNPDFSHEDIRYGIYVHVQFLYHISPRIMEDTVPTTLGSISLAGFDTWTDISSLSYNIDVEAFSMEASLKLLYEEESMKYLRVGQAVRIKVSGQRNFQGGTKEDVRLFTMIGYVSSIKMDQSNGDIWATYTIRQNNTLDTWEIWDYNMTQRRGEHLRRFTELIPLNIWWELGDLDNSEITITTESNTSDSTGDGTNTTSDGSTKTISECFDMAKSFIHPGHDGVYQTGSSTHDPETAWNAYQNGTRHFDCFGCSAFLFYVIKNFAKKAVRVIHRYSSSAGSGTHYTVQLKDSEGNWYDPRDEYRKLDSYLRVNSGPILQVHQVFEG